MAKKYLYSAVSVCILVVTGVIGTGCGTQPGGDATADAGQPFRCVDGADAVMLQHGKHKENCPVCGMNLPTYYKTNHAVTFENGQVFQFCSIHCMVDAMENQLSAAEKEQIEKIQVVDTKCNRLIDARRALYVVGSSKPGTMSMVSKYAFRNKASAAEFSRMYGGVITDYKTAYKRAKEDFGLNNPM